MRSVLFFLFSFVVNIEAHTIAPTFRLDFYDELSALGNFTTRIITARLSVGLTWSAHDAHDTARSRPHERLKNLLECSLATYEVTWQISSDLKVDSKWPAFFAPTLLYGQVKIRIYFLPYCCTGTACVLTIAEFHEQSYNIQRFIRAALIRDPTQSTA